MIGIDTNVLVRYLAQDDAAQSRKVDLFLSEVREQGSAIHIDDVVLCEVVWVLRAAYRLGKTTIVDALEKFLGTAVFSFDDRELLRVALSDFRSGKGDFSDYVIGRRNERAGCAYTVTFDRALVRDATFHTL